MDPRFARPGMRPLSVAPLSDPVCGAAALVFSRFRFPHAARNRIIDHTAVLTMGNAGPRWSTTSRRVRMAVIVIMACLLAWALASELLVDWLWFSAIGYLEVYWIVL